ncbi:MAG TPA: alkaline phosphatase family protein [Pyrinomonadaceae bacterium]|jgi:predicted AlkP superfamily pyrophosphatase or phosphodiesterase|nr:alkaline phosphatase family protein [Pyrinomonadaceae bacterium]
MTHQHVRAMRPGISLTLSLFLAFVSLAGSASAQQQRQTATRANQTTQPAARPRLVLVIVVDQFRADYLERFGDLFAANGGLRRLMRDGAQWTNTNYDHMPTYTAPGHATVMTGAWPSETGIVANDWYERETGCVVSNSSDPEDKYGERCRLEKSRWQLFGGGEGERASSPRRLIASTVGDEMRLVTNSRSKVIGISVKDRGAMLPAGRHANAAYWFSPFTGNMVTSSYYFNELPAWVKSYNEARPADKYCGREWTRLLTGKDAAEYERRAGADAPPWENIGSARDTNMFPHKIAGSPETASAACWGVLDYSPFSNDLLEKFAETAIENEKLGTDADTDVLTVSFSANDYVGHRFGPYSQEAMDITLRVDGQIGALLDFVNRKVGLQNTLVAFTADHGVAPIPEHASALGLTGGRISNTDIMNAARNAVRARFGRRGEEKDSTADYISEPFVNANIFFNTVALKRDGINREEIERVVAEAVLTVPGINRAFTRTQLETGSISAGDVIARRVLHGFHPRRSGDVILVQEPFKYFGEGASPIPATHGSPFSYDTHVPLIIMGQGVAAGRYAQAATPADLAPTLSTLLRLQAPSNAMGRVLLEGLSGK